MTTAHDDVPFRVLAITVAMAGRPAWRFGGHLRDCRFAAAVVRPLIALPRCDSDKMAMHGTRVELANKQVKATYLDI